MKLMMNYLNTKDDESVPKLHTIISDRKKYVEWGVDDNMPLRLLELYNSSGYHRAIIDSRVNMICGDGIEQSTELPYSQRTQDFIDAPNDYETMEELSKKLSFDYEIHALAYIEIKFGMDKKSIAEIHHIDATKIRWGKKTKNKLTHVYYSENWSNIRKYPAVAIPIFNKNIIDQYDTQILPIIRYTPSIDYYALPSYYSIIKWINIDHQISIFHETNILNGFTPTIYFGFPTGVPTEDERAEVEKQIKQKYAGAKKAGGIITAFYEAGVDNKVDIQILSLTDADKQYEWLSKMTQQQILVGHKVTNENLVGISTPGKLGSSTELLDSYKIYYNNVIKHEQNDILAVLNKIMVYNGMNDINFIYDNLEEEVKVVEPIEKTPTAQMAHIGHSSSCNCNKLDKYATVDVGDIIEFEGIKYELKGEIINKDTSLDKIKNADIMGMYVWTLGKGGESEKNCPSCTEHAGKIKTLRNWKRTAIPGVSFASIDTENSTNSSWKFGTFCEANCSCKLIKIN